MSCTGRYAEAWQYASFWCQDQIFTGVDNSGGIGNAFLTDTIQHFLTLGVRANVGMILYNLTDNTSGYVTAATETTITATGVTWDNGDSYRIVTLNIAEKSQIEHYLNITAGDIHAALAAVDACDCTLSTWGANFLAEVNIILARVFHDCPCTRNLTADDKDRYANIANNRLEAIMTGERDVCQDATGKNWPSVGYAERSTTEFAAAQIIVNDIDRNI